MARRLKFLSVLKMRILIIEILAIALNSFSQFPQFVKDSVLVTHGKDTERCVHARPVGIPGDTLKIMVALNREEGSTGGDFFSEVGYTMSSDTGKTWLPLKTFLNIKSPFNGYDYGNCIDPVLTYHQQTARVLLTGLLQYYDGQYNKTGLKTPCYAVYDPEEDTWTDFQIFQHPKGSGHSGGAIRLTLRFYSFA